MADQPHTSRTAWRAQASSRPGISVIVPSLNEGELLRRTINSLRSGLPENGEIIVVDDGSTDGGADFWTGETRSTRAAPPARPAWLGKGAQFRGAARGRPNHRVL